MHSVPRRLPRAGRSGDREQGWTLRPSGARPAATSGTPLPGLHRHALSSELEPVTCRAWLTLQKGGSGR